MNGIILYFSRTGNSKRIAEKISRELGWKTARLTDDISWSGVFGYIKGGSYSLRRKPTNVTIEGNPDLSTYANIILVVPLWAGGIAPAGYSLLDSESDMLDKLSIVISCDKTNPDKALKKLENISSSVSRKYCVVKKRSNENTIIREIVSKTVRGF